jgi:hypothetical protein
MAIFHSKLLVYLRVIYFRHILQIRPTLARSTLANSRGPTVSLKALLVWGPVFSSVSCSSNRASDHQNMGDIGGYN